MSELEIEVTYLVQYIPQDIKEYPHADIRDTYLITNSPDTLRLRKKDDTYALTKKSRPEVNDASIQIEQTIELTEREYETLKQLPGLELHKVRYDYMYEELRIEIDIFQDKLKGLVTAECEFPTEREKNTFIKPEFCLIDISREKGILGNEVQGKAYEDLEELLSNYGYEKI
ncbi:MAG: hypothetical protein M3Q44_00485 [bacterium]|nr:hypothetical protein [bacterium]